MANLFIKIENKEQKTCETCLPVSLIAVMRAKGINIKDDEEMKMLMKGLKLVRYDYAIGQVIYVCRRFPIRMKLYIDSKIYYKILLKNKYPKNLELVNQKIDRAFLKTIDKPVIIYLDKYYTDGIYHSAHFVVLEYLNDNKAIIMDPWDGRKKILTVEKLSKAINSLRNGLKISPKVIEIDG